MTIVRFLANTYQAFVFWTALTGLGVCLWYFPLWHMGISGYEALLFADLAPFILGLTFIQKATRKYRWLFALLASTILVAYQIRKPVDRMMLVGFAYGANMLYFASLIYSDKMASTGRLVRDIYAIEAGLVLSMAVRMACYTNNPVWPIMNDINGGWNKTGLVLGIVALVIQFLQSLSASDDENADAKKHDKRHGEIGTRSGSSAPWASAAFGFGAWLFGIQSMFSESSTLIRWTWGGYPHTGPQPVPFSGLVLTVLVFGFLSGHRVKSVTTTAWWGAGALCAAIITYISGWSGFIPGLVLAAYFGSITLPILQLVARCPPGRTFTLGFFVYNLLVLAHVWVVAYEFVPGGPLLRERTWFVMLSMMLSIFLGVRAARKVLVKESSTSTINLSSSVRADRRYARATMLALTLFGWGAMVARIPSASSPPQPHHPEQRLVTAAIWTIHFDLDNSMWSAEQRIQDAVRDLEADVMGFLESDTERIIMGNRDWTQKVAEELNYYVDYGPSPRKHTWGCAMLSKFPIKKSEHHLLPSPDGELACAIHATLDMYGQDVDVIISHNGQEENPLDRRLQTTKIGEIIRESPNPFIFTGYVVTKPQGEVYNLLFRKDQVYDIDPTDDDRWCQYVGYRGLKRTGYARISRGTITDTEIQAGKFVVPVPGTSVNSTDSGEWAPSYKSVPESHYDPGYHFPTKFRGKGVRGHYYHVFNEPRYYD
ncbi:Protein cwh43 [Mycoemilia scoparia]|uniref:Protein cwh43 n=1 Tax=Mycoemilia scoparia TaxID=417184 RepID=A0A9W8DP90_9FUNG|nr:Protein cwh43 [Mycoemilia scoparia]